MSSWQVTIVTTYVGLLAGLSIFALHRLGLAWRARRLFAPSTPALAAAGGSDSAFGDAGPVRLWPSVVVQLPLYNERFVARRVIDSVCRCDYPRERLRVQVLDDSTDVTSQIVARAVRRWRSEGVDIEHIRRSSREGFKAGALAHGLQHDTSMLVAIFDADFIAPVDFLKRLVPEFDDSGVGMVQARWGHLHVDRSLLTRAQAVLLDGHFINEHGARFLAGYFFNFNGTCGIWRRSAIDDAGGWSHATITEDLELSYRAQMRGWRFVYRPDVVVPGELPATVAAFKSQQHRWAKGSIETARIVLPAIWRRRDLALRTRLEATAHLAANGAYPMVLLLALLMPLAVVARAARPLAAMWALDAALLCGSSLSLVVFYAWAVRRSGNRLIRWYHLPAVLALGVGLAINNTRAVAEALVGHRSAFHRTPKLADPDVAVRRGRAGVYALEVGAQPWFELAVALHLSLAMALAVATGRWAALPFLGLFASGFFWVALGSWIGCRPSVAAAGSRDQDFDSDRAGDDNLQISTRERAARAS